MQGKVLWFNDHKGYGEIKARNGERFFFTYQEIKSNDEFKSIAQNQLVTFSKGTDLLFDSFRAENVIEISKKAKKTPRKRSQCKLV